jgi:hypothetical protein
MTYKLRRLGYGVYVAIIALPHFHLPPWCSADSLHQIKNRKQASRLVIFLMSTFKASSVYSALVAHEQNDHSPASAWALLLPPQL